MEPAGASQPQPSSSTTPTNPVVAVGRKVKSVLGTSQRPSVRISRESSSTPRPRRVNASRGTAEKPLPHPTPDRQAGKAPTWASRFGDARHRAAGIVSSPFRSDEASADDESFEHEYDPDTVDLMDVIDPEVATLSTLTNVQNSLFVPSLGKIINRRPTYRISSDPEEARTIDKLKASLKRLTGSLPTSTGDEGPNSTGSKFQFAVLPEGMVLKGWKKEEKEELDDLVRHMLHSRRAKFKRSLKGFYKYVRRPLGLFITVYATLITLFGAAWVLFLIGWINLGGKKEYVVNVVDNVLVALFAIIGDGLAPFRAVDTYHMIYIAHYHRKTWKTREKLGLPELADHNDLPDQRKEDMEPSEVDLESLVARRMPRGLARGISRAIPKSIARRMTTRKGNSEPSYDYSVLSEEEQSKLEFHERKFSKSHTFYKPHETETHYAFPLKLLVAIVLLLDLHSCLQISLGACTWGIPYQTRPFVLTTVILCCSITCNIMGGVLISMGDKRTRKHEVIERMVRQDLTSEAIEQIQTRQLKEAEERGEVDRSVRKRLEEEREAAENEEIKKSWKVVPSLPKQLLGKGEDHREPSLPQNARRSRDNVATGSRDNVATGSNSSLPKTSKSKNSLPLPPLQESSVYPSQPKPALRRGEESPKEEIGQKVMRFIRRADLDRS